MGNWGGCFSFSIPLPKCQSSISQHACVIVLVNEENELSNLAIVTIWYNLDTGSDINVFLFELVKIQIVLHLTHRVNILLIKWSLCEKTTLNDSSCVLLVRKQVHGCVDRLQ